MIVIGRRRRLGDPLQSIDRSLPSLVALEIVALQCLLRLTPLAAEGYPLL